MNKKQIVETVKTVLIVALITGIAAFIAGMSYKDSQTKDVTNQVQSIVSQLKLDQK